MLPRKGFIEIYDFRKGEDFNQQVEPGKRFSSLASSFIVVDVYPGFHFFNKAKAEALHEAQIRLDDLTRAATERATVGFVAVSGGPRESERVVRENVSELEEQGAVLLGYFEPANGKKQVELRRRHVGYQEWLVGGCDAKFDRVDGTEWNFGTVLEVSGLQCVSMLVGETNQSIFVTRWWDGLDDYLQIFEEARLQVRNS